MTKEAKTLVVFRVFRSGGDVIALFPDIAATRNPVYCESYQHVGQHGAAHYTGCMKASRPALPEEYASLVAELQSPPYSYNLDIRQRATRVSTWRRHQSAG